MNNNFSDIFHNVQDALTDNVVSRSVLGFWKGIMSEGQRGSSHLPVKEIRDEATIVVMRNLKNVVKNGSLFVRIAGFSGASAVALGAYGAHVVYRRENMSEAMREVYERTNHYHFIHSLALLGVPLCRRPMLTGSLLTIGTLIFCGSCYYRVLTGDQRSRKITPYGGLLMILGWLSMII